MIRRFCVTTLALGFLIGCHGSDEPKEKAGKASATAVDADVVTLPAEAMRVAAIQLAPAQSHAAVEMLSMNGSVQADQQRMQQVTAPIAGRVVRVTVSLGERVGAGAPAVVLTSPDIADLRARLVQAEGREGVARASASRTRRLVEIGASAGKESEMANAELRAATADVAHIRGALASYGGSGGDAASVTLRAPASGVVVERSVNPGAVVQAGQQLVTIADLSSVWVIASVAESQIGTIQQGARADIRAASLGSSVVSGTVDYIDPILRPESHTVGVRVSVPNPQGLFRPGMFVEVRIRTSAPNAATTTLPWVPESAIEHLGERTIVFAPVAAPPRSFRVVDVQAGDSVDGYRPILRGLDAGQVVVTSGTFALKSQMLKGLAGDND